MKNSSIRIGVKGKRKQKNTLRAAKRPGFVSRVLLHIKNALLPLLWLGLGALASVHLFPVMEGVFNPVVNKVVVNGDFLYMEKQEVIGNIDIYADDRILGVDLKAVQMKLEALPWVLSAQVVRQWPNRIVVNVEEQKPIARWNENWLFNRYGHLFARQNKVVRNLPRLAGVEGSSDEVLERYQEFSNLLSPYALQITHLINNRRGGWQIKLNTGVELLIGRGDALEKMRHFLVLYEDVLQDADKAVAAVDLRYDNGAAVRWRETDQLASVGSGY